MTIVTESSCPFCIPHHEVIFHEDDLSFGIWDQFPISPGHALLIPKRHIATWFEATEAEQVSLTRGLAVAKKAIEATHQPDAYNIGINSGQAAGQTIPHLHVHLIPRYQGDHEDPRGGIRHIMPDKAKYWE